VSSHRCAAAHRRQVGPGHQAANTARQAAAIHALVLDNASPQEASAVMSRVIAREPMSMRRSSRETREALSYSQVADKPPARSSSASRGLSYEREGFCCVPPVHRSAADRAE
jgi:hypothetical protein